MNIEERMVRKIDREREHEKTDLSPELSLAYEKAKSIFADPKCSIQETDFIPVYGKENVEADIALADHLKAKFEGRDTPEQKKLKQISDIFEAMVLTQAESSKWFGDATLLKTSRFDDYKNKVDMIAEWFTPSEGSRVLALAVDVTFSAESVQEKLEGIKREIGSGELGSIKYFKDKHGDFMGIRNNVPRIVIGVSEPVIEDLADLWVHEEQKTLDEHPIQILFLTEILRQLELMRDYARKERKTVAVRAYEQVLQTVQPIYEKKLALRKRTLARDGVATEIVIDAQKVFGS